MRACRRTFSSREPTRARLAFGGWNHPQTPARGRAEDARATARRRGGHRSSSARRRRGRVDVERDRERERERDARAILFALANGRGRQTRETRARASRAPGVASSRRARRSRASVPRRGGSKASLDDGIERARGVAGRRDVPAATTTHVRRARRAMASSPRANDVHLVVSSGAIERARERASESGGARTSLARRRAQTREGERRARRGGGTSGDDGEDV